jgi:hypothetical protein
VKRAKVESDCLAEQLEAAKCEARDAIDQGRDAIEDLRDNTAELKEVKKKCNTTVEENIATMAEMEKRVKENELALCSFLILRLFFARGCTSLTLSCCSD